MLDPPTHLINEVARRLAALGVPDAQRKSHSIAKAAMVLAVPEALAEVARARRDVSFTNVKAIADRAALDGLRYALVMYASGLQDEGAFARQTLRTIRTRSEGGSPSSDST